MPVSVATTSSPLFYRLAVLVLGLCIPLCSLWPVDPPEGFSFGACIGEPLGLEAKLSLGSSLAFELSAAWALMEGGGDLYLGADFIYHLRGFAMENGPYFRPLIGLGGAYRPLGDRALALRLPVGISFSYVRIPFELEVKAYPGLFFLPETSSYAAGGVSLRYRL